METDFQGGQGVVITAPGLQPDERMRFGIVHERLATTCSHRLALNNLRRRKWVGDALIDSCLSVRSLRSESEAPVTSFAGWSNNVPTRYLAFARGASSAAATSRVCGCL
jgi:hypothetical protein